jgi:hypothetical protein
VTYIASTPSPALTTPTPLPTAIPTGGPRPTPRPIPAPTPMPTGSISITTTPSGAEVYLDNSDSSKGITPITLEDVTVGHHKVKVIKEGYRSETRSNIYLGAGITKELDITLEPITGSIFVSSTPSGASVYLDDVDMNKITPCMLSEVVVGQHTIKLTKSDFFDTITTVSVSVGETLHLHENLAGYGSLNISSDPSGAKVYLDGSHTGETPQNISTVVGNHTIKLTKSDYDDEIKNVSLSVGETLHLHENLTGYGSLSISSIPYGANVSVDGNYTGKTPLLISKVVEGLHLIKLTKQDYADVETMIHVSAGMEKSLDVTLPVQGAVNISTITVLISIISVIIGVLILIEVIVSRRKRLSKWMMEEEDVRPHVESRQKFEFAKRKDIILLNSPEWIKHKDYEKINPLYEEAQELEKQEKNKESIETYKKIIDINEYYIKAWEGLERTYNALGESEKKYSALMKTRSITEFIDFETNAAQKINLQQFELQNLDFFDNLF